MRIRGTRLEVVDLGDGVGPEDCLVWDESLPSPTVAFMAAHMTPPEFPTPLGVLRAVDLPTYEEGVVHQIEAQIEARGHGTLQDLLFSGELWTVEEDGSIKEGFSQK